MFDIENLTSGDISVNGLKIHYYRTGGDKPALVLLHGITDSGQCWPRMVQHLGDDFDMVMVDARGHGLSDAPDRGYGFQEQAGDVVGVVEALKLHRPVLVGHSMGAMTAIGVAACSPGLISALILEDPPLSTQEQIPVEETRSWMEEARIRIRRERGQALSELVANRRVESPNWSEDELIPWAEAKQQVIPDVADIAFSLQLPWRSSFRRIDCPILLLTADHSAGALITPEIADEAASLWSDGRVVNIQDAGHNIRRDQFKNYLAAVSGFLAAV
ncbi:MAG: alpha/beta hydrolase [Anaerolineaceae bacterium]|nr:alpha/beta hydrolase [Anaerolineaceae bacterium]